MSTTQNAVLSVSYTSFTAPPGSVVDHITVTATASNAVNSPAPQSVPAGATTITFANLNPDTYTFSAQAFPATGAGFSSPVTTTLTIVSTQTVILSVPGAITATQP